jgi:hypothetical protein
VIAGVGLVVLAACSGGSGRSAGSTPPTGNPPGVFSSGAPVASAHVTLQGDAALTAAFDQPDVRCGFPDVAGPSIALLSAPQGLFFRVRVQQSKVTVLVSDDASPAHERDFAGVGVSGFTAASGAQVDSPLTEVPSAAGSAGSIGALTSIKASIDCAGQDPGRSTIALTGSTPDGTVSDPMPSTVRVECNPLGDEVVLVGILTVGNQPTFLQLGLRPDALEVDKTVGSVQHQYLSPPGTVTLDENGAHVNGDATEQGGATPPHVLHVEGAATCGTPVS